MHTKVLKIPFVRYLALLGALLTILTTLAQAASSGRAPSICAFYRFEIHNPAVAPSGSWLAIFDASATANSAATSAATFTASANPVNGTLVIQVTSRGSLTASAQGTLAFDLSATGAVSAP